MWDDAVLAEPRLSLSRWVGCLQLRVGDLNDAAGCIMIWRLCSYCHVFHDTTLWPVCLIYSVLKHV